MNNDAEFLAELEKFMPAPDPRPCPVKKHASPAKKRRRKLQQQARRRNRK